MPSNSIRTLLFSEKDSTVQCLWASWEGQSQKQTAKRKMSLLSSQGARKRLQGTAGWSVPRKIMEQILLAATSSMWRRRRWWGPAPLAYQEQILTDQSYCFLQWDLSGQEGVVGDFSEISATWRHGMAEPSWKSGLGNPVVRKLNMSQRCAPTPKKLEGDLTASLAT